MENLLFLGVPIVKHIRVFNSVHIVLLEKQLAKDQTDPWQVVPRQVFTPYNCLLISVAFVALCRVGVS